MAILGFILCVLIFVLLQALYYDMKKDTSTYNTTIDGNLTLASLISNSILETWIAKPPEPTKFKFKPQKSFTNKDNSTIEISTLSTVITPSTQSSTQAESEDEARFSPTVEIQGDDASVATTLSFDSFVETLFDPPLEEVIPDWSIVLGTFSHYDDENWKQFLIKTDVPMIVRMFLADSSETVTFSRELKPKKKNKKQGKKNHNPKLTMLSDYQMTIATSSWLLTHQSKFRLGEVVIEHDLDGTDSKNVFFFSNPRLLIHNKIKDKWRTAIVRHFDETGLNMTIVDRDRLVMARRFFKRNS